MTDHAPIQCVTIPGLMASRASLRRLMIETETRIRDELAKECGVRVGDRISTPEGRMWVTDIRVIFGPGAEGEQRASLTVYGHKVRGSGASHGVTWDANTCFVAKKAPL